MSASPNLINLLQYTIDQTTKVSLQFKEKIEDLNNLVQSGLLCVATSESINPAQRLVLQDAVIKIQENLIHVKRNFAGDFASLDACMPLAATGGEHQLEKLSRSHSDPRPVICR